MGRPERLDDSFIPARDNLAMVDFFGAGSESNRHVSRTHENF